MPAKKQVKPQSTLEKIESLIKKIWLANLGIYSRSKEEIQSRYEKLTDEGQRIFDELVSKGESVETDAKRTINNNRQKLEDRIADLKQRLTYKSSFSTKLDEVNAKLDKLSEAAAEA